VARPLTGARAMLPGGLLNFETRVWGERIHTHDRPTGSYGLLRNCYEQSAMRH
jgi:hypothetical protein